MKKMLLTLVVLVFAAPAFADVDITAAQVGEPCDGRVVISWDATTETTMYVRAFGMNVQLHNDANIVSATGKSLDYWVNPGTIVIAGDGTITSYGSIAAEYSDLPSDTLVGPPDGNGVTLEAATLYAPPGFGSPNAPALSGDLAEIVVDANCTLCLSANVSRAGATGVVMEDPAVVATVNYPLVCLDVEVPKEPDECVKSSDPGYATWLQLGKPNCWCYRHQCQGDADGLAVFFRNVSLEDLEIMKTGFAKTVAELASIPNGLCGDFDHTAVFFRPVTLSDLNILKANFSVPGLADCPMTHINKWLEP